MKVAEIIQKIFVEDAKPVQISDILRRKVEILNIINYLIKACGNSVTVSAGIITVKCIEYNNL